MSGFVPDLDPPALERLWQSFLELLEQPDDNLADPLVYTLAVEYFEISWPGTWEALAQWQPPVKRRLRVDEREALEPAQRRLRRLLRVSASAPWTAKAKTFEQLIGDPQ